MKLTKIEKTIEYKNPFETSTHKQEVYTRVSPKVFETEKGMIVEVNANQYDYLVNGELVTQRCGASKELLEKLIEHNVKARDYEIMHKISKGEL